MAARGSLDMGITEAAAPSQGQRGGRRGGLAEAQCEDTEQAEVLASKNVSVAQLVHFYKKKEQDDKLGPESTCWEVVQDVIIPDTASELCCYMDIVVGSPKKPEVMVSHWWGMSFRELVLAIAQHASGISARGLLEKKTFSSGLAHQHLEKTYWLCMFAANHHKSNTQGPHLGGAVLSGMSTFLVVLDHDLGILSRAWCMFEIWQASQAGVAIHFSCGQLAGWKRGEAAFQGLELCRTTDPQDKDRLMKHCEFQIGLMSFNSGIEELVLSGVRMVAWNAALREGDLPTMTELLKRRVDVNAPASRLGEAALCWACQHAGQGLVELLLESRADPNMATLGGWSPLHYAVQSGNEGITSALLEARADATRTAQNGRTAMLDAAERGYVALAGLLLDARADPDAADVNGCSAVHFARDLSGTELAHRLGWSPDRLGQARARSSRSEGRRASAE